MAAAVESGVRVAMPGDIIAAESEVVAGAGTRVADGRVLSTILGAVVERTTTEGRRHVCVVSQRTARTTVVPAVGDIVVCRVTRINPRIANLEIVAVRGTAVAHPFSGIIRKVDVREFEVDKVEMAQCFLPGDVVRAEVLSLGDSRSYFLTTARTDLGVVHALSMGGNVMVPIDWEHMQCPVTKELERRKVARPADSTSAATSKPDVR